MEKYLSWYRLHQFAKDLGNYKIVQKEITDRTHSYKQIIIEYDHRIKNNE